MDEFNKTLDLDGLTYYDTKIKEVIEKKAPLASPTLTGAPKAPTASAGTNTTQIATTAFVQTAVSNGIAASDAMIIKGTIGTSGTVTSLPTTYKTGWTYRVVTAGTYAGQVCEIGDLIVALFDRSGSGNVDTDWCVAQTNINGAITGVKSGDAYITVSQSGSVVTITHKDVTRNNTTSTATPSHGGTFTAVKTVTSDAKGHVTGIDTETITIPNSVATQSSAGLESAADKKKLDGIATGAEVNQNAFSKVTVGSTTIEADSKTDTLTLVAGSNVTLTPDATTDKITIASAHPSITTSTDTTSTASPSAGGTFTTVDSVTRDSNGHVTKVNTKTITLPKTDITVDDALSDSSENPVQNKVVTTEINNVSNKIDSVEFKAYMQDLGTVGLPGAFDSIGTTLSSMSTEPSLPSLIQKIRTCIHKLRLCIKILNNNVGAIQGITDSLTATSSNVALSAAGGNNLQGQINTLNSNLLAKASILHKNCTDQVQIFNLIDDIFGEPRDNKFMLLLSCRGHVAVRGGHSLYLISGMYLIKGGECYIGCSEIIKEYAAPEVEIDGINIKVTCFNEDLGEISVCFL